LSKLSFRFLIFYLPCFEHKHFFPNFKNLNRLQLHSICNNFLNFQNEEI
jgi:hypothetical protein